MLPLSFSCLRFYSPGLGTHSFSLLYETDPLEANMYVFVSIKLKIGLGTSLCLFLHLKSFETWPHTQIHCIQICISLYSWNYQSFY